MVTVTNPTAAKESGGDFRIVLGTAQEIVDHLSTNRIPKTSVVSMSITTTADTWAVLLRR